MSHCTIPGCASRVSRLGLCSKHYTQQWRGRDPQAFINERERLLRIDKGTGDTWKADGSRNQRGALTTEQKGALTLNMQQREQPKVTLARVGFLERRQPGEPADLKERWR